MRTMASLDALARRSRPTATSWLTKPKCWPSISTSTWLVSCTRTRPLMSPLATRSSDTKANVAASLATTLVVVVVMFSSLETSHTCRLATPLLSSLMLAKCRRLPPSSNSLNANMKLLSACSLCTHHPQVPQAYARVCRAARHNCVRDGHERLKRAK